MKTASLALAVALIASTALALTAAPQPVKPVSASMYSGRWYEVARIAEGKERRCGFPTSDFAAKSGGGYSIVYTCHDLTADGPAHAYKATVTLVPGAGNAKIKAAFLGGLVTKEYWIVDHSADDNAWAFMATPGGNFLFVLSRRTALTPQEHAAVVARITALGYDAAHLKPSR